MKEREDTSADEPLISLSGIYQEVDCALVGIDPEEELDKGGEAGTELEVVHIYDDDNSPATLEPFSENKMHDLMLQDPWAIGIKIEREGYIV